MNNLNSQRKFGRMACMKLRDDFAGAIGRVALDDDDFLRGIRKGLCPDAIQKSSDRGGFIVDGNDDGNLHGCPQIRRRCHLSEYRLRPSWLYGPENMRRAATPFPICCGWYMTRKADSTVPDLFADPFAERSEIIAREHFQLLGGRFQFESESPRLLRLVNSAYRGLPPHRLSTAAPRLRIRLMLNAPEQPHPRSESEPPPLSMVSGAGYLGGATNSSNFVLLSPSERTALVVLSRRMLRFPTTRDMSTSNSRRSLLRRAVRGSCLCMRLASGGEAGGFS